MLQAVGNSNAAWWARLFHDQAADCDCPEAIIAPRIFFNGVFNDGTTSTGVVVEARSVDYGGKRAFWQLAYPAGGSGKSRQNFLCGLSGAVAGDYIKVRMYDAPTYNMTPANAGGFATEPPWSDRPNLAIEGGNPCTEQAPGSNYVEWVSLIDAAAQPTEVKVIAAYRWPDPSAVDVRHTFYIEIIEINGVSIGALGP
jgi:hypothetical protein